MKLFEAINDPRLTHEGFALAARKPFTWGADAAVIQLDDGFEMPLAFTREGYEIVLPADDIQHLRETTESKHLSDRAFAELLIHYCLYDAYPAWLDEIPDK